MKSKLLSMCLSLLIAVAIWLYVTNVVSPESSEVFRDIPVQFQSVSLLEERGLIITEISHPEVSLQLFGNRTDLMRLNSDNIRVFADVSKIYEPGVHEISYTESFPGTIASGAVEIQSRSPATIRVTVEKKATKKINVEVEYKGAVPQGYLTDEANIQLSAKSINISGPESVVEAVDAAKVTVDLTNRTETISHNHSYLLVDRDGNAIVSDKIRADVSFVYVSLQIRMLKEVPVTYDVIYGSGATPENTKITANVQSVKISGHKNLLEQISSIHLGQIVLADRMESGTITLPIEMPTGVRNETSTRLVSVEITFNGLETKNLSTSNIQAINVPNGMNVVFVTKKLNVTIRGTKEALEKVDASDITVLVDFAYTREGTSTMPVEIAINTGNQTDVGAIGQYTLIADMHRG